jgi:hypothetical protein
MRKTYKGFIKTLEDDEVFVFGSNPLGYNGNPQNGTGGAALVASSNGWCGQREIMDNTISRCGMAYGLTTVEHPGGRLTKSPSEICNGISQLYEYATKNSNKKFYIAYTGENAKSVNLNGYRTIDMAAFFMMCGNIPENIIFQDKFYNIMLGIKCE